MDASVVSDFRPQAFASRTAAERVKTGARPPGAFEISRLPVAQRPPQPTVARGPSASSALLSDAPRHRPRRASLHPAPRRSQRRLTPFFSSLLPLLLALATGLASLSAQEKPDAPVFLGETLRYAMTILGVAGGDLTLSAGQVELHGRSAYKFEMSALSNNFLSKFFLVRDNIVSWIDPKSFRSLRFEKHTVEGKRVKDEL